MTTAVATATCHHCGAGLTRIHTRWYADNSPYCPGEEVRLHETH